MVVASKVATSGLIYFIFTCRIIQVFHSPVSGCVKASLFMRIICLSPWQNTIICPFDIGQNTLPDIIFVIIMTRLVDFWQHRHMLWFNLT